MVYICATEIYTKFSGLYRKIRWLDMFQASVFEFENLNEEWAFFSRLLI